MVQDLHDIPGVHVVEVAIAPITEAEFTTQSHPIFRAPFECDIRGVNIIFGETVTGAATNYINLNLINRGTANEGTTELANRDYSGTTVTDTQFTVRALYAPATYLNVDQNTCLDLEFERTGSGMAMPPMLVQTIFEGA